VCAPVWAAPPLRGVADMSSATALAGRSGKLKPWRRRASVGWGAELAAGWAGSRTLTTASGGCEGPHSHSLSQVVETTAIASI